MAEFPALPLFTDAIIADTNHLTNEEFGAYMRILMLVWRSPDCKIPAADAWIMRKMCANDSKFKDLIKPLISEFLQHDRGGNWLTQKRLSKEFEFVKKQREKNSVSAKSRWNKEKDPCERNAPTPTPTPTPIKERTMEDREKISPLEIGMDFEIFWQAYPKKSARNFAINAYRQAREEGTDHATIIAGVERYAENSKGTEERYLIPPDKWLAGGHWSDEYRDSSASKSSNRKPAYADTIKSAARVALDNIRAQDEIRAQSKQG
jgi:uncharacterized protein YdaU (DUF1376 family)